MGIGPAPAARAALERAGLKLDDIDLWEINEAFAGQILGVVRELGLDLEKLNVNGGAIALGHPLAATGTRLMLTLLKELRRRGVRYGLAGACIGGGQGIALVAGVRGLEPVSRVKWSERILEFPVRAAAVDDFLRELRAHGKGDLNAVLTTLNEGGLCREAVARWTESGWILIAPNAPTVALAGPAFLPQLGLREFCGEAREGDGSRRRGRSRRRTRGGVEGR